MPPRTTLILGAGASHNYGYPVGALLRQRIIGLKKQGENAASEMRFSYGDLLRFIDEFLHSQMYSIDAFLARRMDLAPIGKAAIAKVLLQCESEGVLFSETSDDHWYQYLLNVLADERWDRFDPSWLSIITFNYDRSLERYLIRSLQAVYDKQEVEVRDKLKGLRIRHVYGDLGSLWQDAGGFPYGMNDQLPERIRRASERLRVIPEGRDDDPLLHECKEIVEAAERICFLGFGFDATNLRRIGAPDVFLHPAARTAKRIAATAHGLTVEEIMRAAVRVVGESAFNNPVALKFHPMTCLRLLRESLIID